MKDYTWSPRVPDWRRSGSIHGKNRKMTYKIKIYASMWRTVLCTYFLVLSDRSAVSTSSRRKGKRSSTGIKVFCVVSLDNYEHAQTVNPYSCGWLSKTKKWLPFFRVILTLVFETLREPWSPSSNISYSCYGHGSTSIKTHQHKTTCLPLCWLCCSIPAGLLCTLWKPGSIMVTMK